MNNTGLHADKVFVFGETMIELSGVTGKSAVIGVAGDTYNTAVYLSRAGVSTDYVTALDDDLFSAQILSAMSEENIGARSVLTLPGGAPGLYAINLDSRGERSFTYWRSASAVRHFFEAPGARKIVDEMKAAKMLYLSGITLSIFTEIHRRDILKIVQAISAAGGEIALDTNYRANGWRNQNEAAAAINAIMPFVTIALPTCDDERALLGDADVESCAAR